jgi:hypothetical protein
LGRSCPVLFIQNNTSRVRGSETLYQVRLEKVEDSRAIRSKFGFFFQGGEDRRPSDLSSVSVRNWVTHETRVRLAIMKILGKRYKDSNPGSKVRVVSYEPRPSLHLTPPPSSKDKKVKRFDFIESVTRLPTSFTSAEITTIMKVVGNKFMGRLRSLFIVISDDMRRIRPSQAPDSAGGESSTSAEVEQAHSAAKGVTGTRPNKRGAPSADADVRSSKSKKN